MCVMRGGPASPTCISIPPTLPIAQSSRSISFLSSTSRTRCTSASHDLEWNRNQSQHECNQYDQADNGIADPPVAVLAEVERIVHEKKKRHDCKRESRAG